MFKKIAFPLMVAILCSLFTLAPVFAASVDGVEYSTHIENKGWQDYVRNGNPAGTTGESLRLEGLKVRLINPSDDLGIEYRTHVQDIGWQDWVSNDQLAGTEGQAKRLEAVSIRLTGDGSKDYNVFYHVHAQDYGWLGWAKNGADAGTAGMAKRLEAIEIKVLPASEEGPTSDVEPFIEGKGSNEGSTTPDNDSPVNYRTFIAGKDWQGNWSTNGMECGSGDANGIEGIQIGLNDHMRDFGGIQYKKLSNAGWTDWAGENQDLVSPGDPIQGIRIKLTGKLAFARDIWYRIHVPNVGWTNLAKNGEACGSEGMGRPASLVQIWITEKADQPNAPYGNAFYDKTWYWPLDGIHGLSTTFGPQGSSHHDGIDIPAPEGTPIHSAKAGIVKYVGYADGLDHSLLYGAFGNCVCVENDSGEMCYYAHMSRFNTSVNERVQKGQVIGYVGTTGNSLGNHLHFEVYNSGGNMTDPMGFYR